MHGLSAEVGGYRGCQQGLHGAVYSRASALGSTYTRVCIFVHVIAELDLNNRRRGQCSNLIGTPGTYGLLLRTTSWRSMTFIHKKLSNLILNFDGK